MLHDGPLSRLFVLWSRCLCDSPHQRLLSKSPFITSNPMLGGNVRDSFLEPLPPRKHEIRRAKSIQSVKVLCAENCSILDTWRRSCAKVWISNGRRTWWFLCPGTIASLRSLQGFLRRCSGRTGHTCTIFRVWSRSQGGVPRSLRLARSHGCGQSPRRPSPGPALAGLLAVRRRAGSRA